jgi:ubiquinone/menaquinone biosynthesis C-methylase UbiE
MKDLFTRYWDSEEKAAIYDKFVEGGESIFEKYNHESEMYGMTHYYDQEKLDVVLDAGCGNGRFLESLPADTVSIGIDASLNLLRIAQKKGRGTFHVCCELEHLPFPDDFFGTVMSCRVLQHLREQERAVQELCRVTRSNGMIILELYNTWNPKTIYKNIRMSPYRTILNYPFRLIFRSMSPFSDWGLSYDKYNDWFQVKNWLRKYGMQRFRGRGVGFGYHKYLLAPFMINAFLEKRAPDALRWYYARCFEIEKLIGSLIPFRYIMEKFVIVSMKNR